MTYEFSSSEIGEMGEGKKVEFIGEMKIGNFEASGLLDNGEIAEFLREVLPITHLEGCQGIWYDPEHPFFREDPNLLGFFDLLDREIRIGPADRFEGGSQEILETLLHEVGHNVYVSKIESELSLALKWKNLYLKSLEGKGGFVSEYAMRDEYEDFAETYRAYVVDPEYLRLVNPEKYEFMEDKVFLGWRPSIWVWKMLDAVKVEIDTPHPPYGPHVDVITPLPDLPGVDHTRIGPNGEIISEDVEVEGGFKMTIVDAST